MRRTWRVDRARSIDDDEPGETGDEITATRGARRRGFFTGLLVGVSATVVTVAGIALATEPRETSDEQATERPAGTAAPNTTTPSPAPTTGAPAETSPPVTVAARRDADAPAAAASPDTDGVQFSETFDDPSSLDRFVFQVMVGNVPVTDDGPFATWQGDHDLDCGGADTTRTVHRQEFGDAGINFDPGEHVYWCREHMMTSMHTHGYAQVDFAPNVVFQDVETVCWDQNMTEMGRKWTQVLVVPESIYQANDERLDYIVPSLQDDVAVRGIRLEDDSFLLSFLRGSTNLFVGQSKSDVNFAGFTTQDKAQRFKNCMTDNEDGTITFELERADGIETRTLAGSFPDGPSRVIFQDDTYNDDKDDTPRPANTYTWHWDNIVIS